jgi:hypothetical protein
MSRLQDLIDRWRDEITITALFDSDEDPRAAEFTAA